MPLFGSSSRNTTNNFDERIAVANDGVGVNSGGGHVTINQTSDEAVKLAEIQAEVTGQQTQAVFQIGSEMVGSSFDALQQAQRQMNNLTSQVLQQSQDDSTQLSEMMIKFGLPALALIGVVMMVGKK